MTLKELVLNEVNVEFGNGQSLAVTSAVKPKISYDKTGAKAEPYTKTADLATAKQDTKACVANIVNYLKSKNLWNKVATKQDFDTTDLVFQADGSCTINFDEGGSIKIPASVANCSKKVEPTIRDKFKKMLTASVVTEDVINEGFGDFVKNKLMPAAVMLGLFGASGVTAAYSTKAAIKNTRKAIQVIAANRNKLQAKVGNDNISYDASRNVITVNGKSGRASKDVENNWNELNKDIIKENE